jgi:uncharacterized protein YbaR (Trm112 family)
MDRQVIDLLRCPVSYEPLTLAADNLLNQLNSRIGASSFKNLAGRTVKDRFDAALVNRSRSVAYPVRQDVPVVQSHLGIPLSGGVTLEPSRSHAQNPYKMLAELDFWHGMFDGPPYDHSGRYHYLFFDRMRLRPDFFENRRVLDIGCGPHGSLDCLEGAAVRVGLDPLAESYLQFRDNAYKTQYVCGVAEDLPFQDHSFDIVTSMNSLDHVDNLAPVLAEIDRAIAPGGHFVLFTDIHEEPTTCEPTSMPWGRNGEDWRLEYAFRPRKPNSP